MKKTLEEVAMAFPSPNWKSWRWLYSKSVEKTLEEVAMAFSVQNKKAGDGYVANQWKNIGRSGYGFFQSRLEELCHKSIEKTLEEVAIAGDFYVANQWKKTLGKLFN